jgi:hypothetical protein
MKYESRVVVRLVNDHTVYLLVREAWSLRQADFPDCGTNTNEADGIRRQQNAL